MLRAILCRFVKYDATYDAETWGDIYTGVEDRRLTREEAIMRERIRDGSLSRTRARMVAAILESDAPMFSRIEFIEGLAALVALHWDEVQRKVPICFSASANAELSAPFFPHKKKNS